MFLRSVIRSTVFALGTAAVATFAAADARAAQCEPFPNVSLWGELTHDSVTRYVETAYNGDWTPFVQKLERYQSKVRQAHAQGRTVKVSQHGKTVALNGHKLNVFVHASEWRLDVVKCLARENATKSMSVEAMQNFATAAGVATTSQAAMAAKKADGSNVRPTPAVSMVRPASEAVDGVAAVEFGSIRTTAMDMRVESLCSAGVAVFRMTNVGDRWPDMARIGLYKLDDGEPVQLSARDIRFAEGQMSTFKIRTDRVRGTKFGLWVDPKWESRPRSWDATVSCGEPAAQ